MARPDQLEVILREALLCRHVPCGSNFSPWMIVNAAEGQHGSTPALTRCWFWRQKRTKGREKLARESKKTDREPTRVPNHDCWGTSRLHNLRQERECGGGGGGGREGENERLEKGVQWGKERNSFWGDIWLWLRGAVWTSQPLPLVLTGLFRGKLMLFVFWIASGLLIDGHEPRTLDWAWIGSFGRGRTYRFVCLCARRKYTTYLWECVMTAGEAGTYTKHKFFLENAKPFFLSVGSATLFDGRTWAIFVNNSFSTKAQKNHWNSGSCRWWRIEMEVEAEREAKNATEENKARET